MIKKEYKYSALTSKIIGCAIEVHKYLGNSFQKLIYQRSLQKEFFYSKSKVRKRIRDAYFL